MAHLGYAAVLVVPKGMKILISIDTYPEPLVEGPPSIGEEAWSKGASPEGASGSIAS